MAARVRSAVLSRLGYTLSAGVAGNKMLGKVRARVPVGAPVSRAW